MKIFTWYAILLIALALGSCNQSSNTYINASAGDAIYYGGDIITMEGDSVQYVEALVIKNERRQYGYQSY